MLQADHLNGKIYCSLFILFLSIDLYEGVNLRYITAFEGYATRVVSSGKNTYPL